MRGPSLTRRSLGGAPLALALALVATTLGVCGSARGDVFGPISLLSASPVGQAEYAHDPALSEDGRYVVFDGSVGGVPGVWRRAAAPGSPLEQVAGGDATLPSLSADGRYVSFTSNEGASLPAITDGALHAGTAREAPQVYVRDMERASGEAGAFTLVSAKNHSSEALSYEFPGASEAEAEGKAPHYGAVAAGRGAITADGRTVVFVTTAQSDLAGPGTPPMQVAVRHLDSEETQLVSVRFDPATGRPAIDPETGRPEPVPEEEERYGAVWSKEPAFSPTAAGAVTRGYQPPTLPGASISADGSAVAWYGSLISEQARTLPGEAELLRKLYAEPLWRRISGGPAEPTRRVTGGSEPENPACIASPESRLPSTPVPGDPCQGPFAAQTTGIGTWNGSEEADYVPRLSRDGDYVAFLATAPLSDEAGAFGIGGANFNADAYREDMTAATRAAGLTRLTQFASADTNRIQTNSGVRDLAISADGQQIALTTRRTVFPLGVPAYVSAPSAVPGLAELFEADLSNETLTRVTRGYEGGTPEHPEIETGNEERYARSSDGALSPSFSADGLALAFSSTASNLVFGDGNTPANGQGEVDGADVFVVPRIVFSAEPTPQTISPPPSNPSLEPVWQLGVKASSLADGAVRLTLLVPAAGNVRVSAASTLPARSARVRGRVRRTVASASLASSGPSAAVTATLKLGGAYRALARRRGGLSSVVNVTFSAPGHPALRRSLRIHFVQRAAASRRPGRRR
ncbi:MAG TPA: hypothetical protein VN618_10025 [Solirubrobacteraceae bacterium]|nr:hypothetical protein [Solirubrobacteraceae bacterium]